MQPVSPLEVSSYPITIWHPSRISLYRITSVILTIPHTSLLTSVLFEVYLASSFSSFSSLPFLVRFRCMWHIHHTEIYSPLPYCSDTRFHKPMMSRHIIPVWSHLITSDIIRDLTYRILMIPARSSTWSREDIDHGILQCVTLRYQSFSFSSCVLSSNSIYLFLQDKRRQLKTNASV